ncbi:shikimate dehydrogenase [Pseudokineococcus lusitanus]|uniref:Shikimate dehydrogenase n=1 Tax=Pseudokineococcus lusitanus TaxID=763993 RepID=A0A3N1G9D3_9ACTN|nr:shikimate dehydrogenase [Pseudokineococcus lusitanus]ROP26837.1 shikimate dehydrogenase [Pseudokineococcus lusitanus]
MTQGTTPRRAAVLGRPVAHSLSPAMHRAAYAALRLDGWSYDARETDEADLARTVAACGDDSAWAGLSLTMPLKRAVVPLLAGTDPVAAATGVVNTVTWDDDRRPHGANTDVDGVERAVAAVLTPAAAPRTGLVLGGGATGVSAVAALARLGCTEVVGAVRDPARARPLLAVGVACDVAVRLVPFAGAAAAVDAADVVVSTAPAGAADVVAADLPPAGERPQVLLDVVYAPWPTALAAAWGRRGPVVDGLEMLAHQAVGQVRLMTGHAPDAAVLRAAALAERRRRAEADLLGRP